MLPADRQLFERIGQRIRELRENASLSQEQVGDRAGFGGKYIGEIEKGIRDVPLSTLRAVVENGLGVTLETIFSGRTRYIERAEHARDVELTAAALADMPLRVRRAVNALVKALDEPKHASRAAEKPSKRR